jgi:sugar phosphate permease
VTANAVVSRWFVRRLGIALGITAFGVGIAGVILPPVIAWVMPLIGWRLLWRFAGLITAFIVLPLTLWIVRDRPGERDGTYYLTGADGASAHHRHGAGQGNLGWMDILKRRNFWLIVICFLPMLSLYGGVQQNIAPIAASYGLKQESAGLLLSIFSFAGVAAMLVTGMLSDRFGNRLPLAGLTALSAAGGLVIGYGHGFLALAVGAGLVGVANGMWTLLPAAMALEFGASGVGRAFGALMLFIPLNSFAPSLIAKTAESSGSYGPAMLVIAAITLVGGALVLLMREKRGGHATPEEREAALEEVPNPIP